MKILEPGKTGKVWIQQHRCTGWGYAGSGCDALLELEIDDLCFFEGTGGSDMTWGYRDPAVSFKCPCCGKLTDLGRNDWPTGYKELKRWTKEWKEAKPSSV